MPAVDPIAVKHALINANRANTVPLVFAEACKLRDEQDQRLEYTRRITGQFLSIFLPGSVFVALSIFQERVGVDRVVLWISISLVVLGFGLAFPVFKTRKWQHGPSVNRLIKGPLTDGIPLQDFYLTLAVSYDSEYEANEKQVRSVQRLFAGAIGCFLLSAAVILIGLAAYNGAVSSSDQPDTGPEPTAPAPPSEPAETVPPLPEVTPVEPTYGEKGANEHYETRPG